MDPTGGKCLATGRQLYCCPNVASHFSYTLTILNLTKINFDLFILNKNI